MSYLVLARKWRPQQFAEILGQHHVTRTLTNALSSGRVAHAFLFTGARGVGKTSAARILAKALNCESTDGPTATPCGTCTSCVEIAEGRSTDVFEIDAASNTGVANVREIIDNVRYLPNSSRHKIYIIDEVHMLSTGAFNALLKTIEEPPPHVKFILATTDVHKVPVTILSRCQRYDFRRIPLSGLTDRLSEILTEEGIAHDKSALSVIARESEGSMRDAQSLLERVLTYAGDRSIDPELVREALGVADQAVLVETVEAMLAREPGRVVELIAGVHERGLELKRFGDALVEYVRDLLMAKLLDDPSKVLDRPADELRTLIERSQAVDAPTLERLFERMCKVVEEVANSAYPRFALEVGLASLAEAPPRVPLDQLVRQLEDLDARVSGRIPPASSGAGRSAGRERSEAVAPPRPFRETLSEPAAPPPKPSPEPVVAARPEPPVEAIAELEPPHSADDPSAAPLPDEEPDPTPARAGGGAFESFVALVRKKRPTLSGSLAQVRPLAFGPGRVELGAETKFDESTLGAQDTKRYLETLLTEHFGQDTELFIQRVERTVVPEEKPRSLHMPPTLLEQQEAEERARRKKKEEDARGRKAVRVLTEELGAKVAKVHVLDD